MRSLYVRSYSLIYFLQFCVIMHESGSGGIIYIISCQTIYIFGRLEMFGSSTSLVSVIVFSVSECMVICLASKQAKCIESVVLVHNIDGFKVVRLLHDKALYLLSAYLL